MENSIWVIKAGHSAYGTDTITTFLFGGTFTDLCEALPSMFSDDEIIELSIIPYENFSAIDDFVFFKEQTNG